MGQFMKRFLKTAEEGQLRGDLLRFVCSKPVRVRWLGAAGSAGLGVGV